MLTQIFLKQFDLITLSLNLFKIFIELINFFHIFYEHFVGILEKLKSFFVKIY